MLLPFLRELKCLISKSSALWNIVSLQWFWYVAEKKSSKTQSITAKKWENNDNAYSLEVKDFLFQIFIYIFQLVKSVINIYLLIRVEYRNIWHNSWGVWQKFEVNLTFNNEILLTNCQAVCQYIRKAKQNQNYLINT